MRWLRIEDQGLYHICITRIRFRKTYWDFHYLCSQLITWQKRALGSLLTICNIVCSPWITEEKKVRILTNTNKIATNNTQMCSLHKYNCCSQYFWHFRRLGNASGVLVAQAELPLRKFSGSSKCFLFHCLKVNPNHFFLKYISVSWAHKMTKLVS